VIGTYGRLFLISLINEIAPVTRARLRAVVLAHPELDLNLGRKVSLDTFLDWLIWTGAIDETLGVLKLTELGKNVTTQLCGARYNKILARAYLSHLSREQ
jgi:hypothetical protein